MSASSTLLSFLRVVHDDRGYVFNDLGDRQWHGCQELRTVDVRDIKPR